MKVIVKLAIELDPEAWSEQQGLSDTRARTVSEDVRAYVINIVQGSSSIADVEADISLTR